MLSATLVKVVVVASVMASMSIIGARAGPISVDDIKLDHLMFHNDEYVHQLFVNFARQYQKEYYHEQGDEFLRRKEIFRSNLYKIHMLNEAEQGTATYGLNEFSDRSHQELQESMLGLRLNNKLTGEEDHDKTERQFNDLWQQLLADEDQTEEELIRRVPKEFDWRKTDGVVTPVKNQGHCGSCWAFSATGNIEGQLKLANNESVSLSEQDLVDCDVEDSGCDGGLPVSAYREIIRLGGIETECKYPYKAKQDDKCRESKGALKYKIVAYTRLPKDEIKMKVWLAKKGPISIGLNANVMQLYREGVAHPDKTVCDDKEDSLDHAVLLVGYGVDHDTPYWLIKNSWGPYWGEHGYYRLYRGDNSCGVGEMGSTALVR